jgi:hypothetical protein
VRVGIALMFALFGMALGGWMSGAIFDLTGPTAPPSPTASCGICSTSRSSAGC